MGKRRPEREIWKRAGLLYDVLRKYRPRINERKGRASVESTGERTVNMFVRISGTQLLNPAHIASITGDATSIVVLLIEGTELTIAPEYRDTFLAAVGLGDAPRVDGVAINAELVALLKECHALIDSRVSETSYHLKKRLYAAIRKAEA
jgi:hypothetical protein